MIKINKILSLLIVILTLISVNQWAAFPIGNTITDWIIYILTLFFFVKGIKAYYNKENDSNLIYFHYYLIWVLVCISRGFFVAEGYWDWKNLTSGIITLLLPLSLYSFTNKELLQIILRNWVRISPVLCVFILIFNEPSILGFCLAPIILITFFIPVLNLKYKFAIIIISLFVIISGLIIRSNVIKYSVPILFVIGYYLNVFKFDNLSKTIRLLFLFLPFFLMILAVSGLFNVFNMTEYFGKEIIVKTNSKNDNGQGVLTEDTRTFLYYEVISSAVNNNYVLWGRTPARGNDSESFGSYMAIELKTKRWERFTNEVGILNIFTWTGLLGVILYFLIFWKASFLALYHSNNIYIKLIGLYIAFRWTFSFVEDFNRFDIMNLTLWMMIAMSYSKAFREMSNEEFKYWIYGIFHKRYSTKIPVNYKT